MFRAVIPHERTCFATARLPRMDIQVKRLYSPRGPQDGTRVLVDRLWPRGFVKGTDAIDVWLKDLAPSGDLRVWFGHEPARWLAFKERYFAELATKGEALQTLLELMEDGPVTLVYSARDELHNQAVALREYLRNA